jgi:hypothetical protein
MTDKPYEERLGGSYVVDPKSGKAARKEGTEQPQAGADASVAEPAAEPAETDKPATEKKGK